MASRTGCADVVRHRCVAARCGYAAHAIRPVTTAQLDHMRTDRVMAALRARAGAYGGRDATSPSHRTARRHPDAITGADNSTNTFNEQRNRPRADPNGVWRTSPWLFNKFDAQLKPKRLVLPSSTTDTGAATRVSPFNPIHPQRVAEVISARPIALGHVSVISGDNHTEFETGDFVDLCESFGSESRTGLYLKDLKVPGVMDQYGVVQRFGTMRLRFGIFNFPDKLKDLYNDQMLSSASQGYLAQSLPHYRKFLQESGIDPLIFPKLVLFNADSGNLLSSILDKGRLVYDAIGPGRELPTIDAARVIFNTDKPTMQQEYAAHQLLCRCPYFLMLPSSRAGTGKWYTLPKSSMDQVAYVTDQVDKIKALGTAAQIPVTSANMPTPKGDYSLLKFCRKLGIVYAYNMLEWLKEEEKLGWLKIPESFSKRVEKIDLKNCKFDSIYDKFYIDLLTSVVGADGSFSNPIVKLASEIISRAKSFAFIDVDVLNSNTPPSERLLDIIRGKKSESFDLSFVRMGLLEPDYDFEKERLGWSPGTYKQSVDELVDPNGSAMMEVFNSVNEEFWTKYLDSNKVDGVYKSVNTVNTVEDRKKTRVKEKVDEKKLKKGLEVLKRESFSIVDTSIEQSSDGCDHLREEFDLPVYVIDDADAKELDDGVSVDGDWIHIHIADPTYYMSPKSDANLLAEYRSSSFYSQTHHLPMVPEAVSLTANLQRGPALTISVKLGQDGQYEDIKILPTFLKDVRYFSYGDVNTILDWSKSYGVSSPGAPWVQSLNNRTGFSPEVLKTFGPCPLLKGEDIENLRKLQKLVERNRLMRVGKGAFTILEASTIASVREDKSFVGHKFLPNQRSPYEIKLSNRTMMQVSPAMVLIADCMIIANAAAASYTSENKIPNLYRGLDLQGDYSSVERIKIVNEIGAAKDPMSGIITSTDLNFSIGSKLTHKLEPIRHDALGVDGYTRITSPLRRFTDTALHFNLKSHFVGAKYVYDVDSLTRLSYKVAAVEMINRFMGITSRYTWCKEYARRLDYITMRGDLDKYINKEELDIGIFGEAEKARSLPGAPDGYLPYMRGYSSSPFEKRYEHDVYVLHKIPDSSTQYLGVVSTMSSLSCLLVSSKKLQRGDVIKAVMNPIENNTSSIACLDADDHLATMSLRKRRG